MAEYDYDIGVIGGGAAGLTVAAGSAQLGARTILIEKEEALGGDCLHYGCVPSKTLIHTARVYRQARRFETFGLPPLDLPPVDFSRIAARIRQVIETIQHHDSEERFCSLGARVEFGSCRFKDEHSIDLDGKTITARSWVVATGSSPAVPPIEGLAETPHITNREIFSLSRLPESMIVLGAGPIGMEMSQAFSRLGTRVQVIQLNAQVLDREDKDLADQVQKNLEKDGVIFNLNAKAKRVRDLGNEKEVVIETAGGAEKSLKGETILVAIGRRMNVDGLDLEKAGVKYNRRGIPVDRRMRTSQKHIYAAGDVTGKYLFTHAAGYEGGIVVSNAVFHLPRRVDYTNLPWCTYVDPELASVGYNESRAKTMGINYEVFSEEFRDNDRAQAEAETIGKIKMLLDEKEKTDRYSDSRTPCRRTTFGMGGRDQRPGKTDHPGRGRSSLSHAGRD